MLQLPLRSMPSAEVLANTQRLLGAVWQPDYARLSVRLLSALPDTAGDVVVLGVAGAQGTGKSTLAAHLQALVAALGGEAAVLSLDDLYLPLADRVALAAEVHPLLRTRGVPGTHDVGLGMSILSALSERPAPQLSVAVGDHTIAMPRFDKGLDDRLPVSQWRLQRWPVALVIVEGWCLSMPPETAQALQSPVNQLEHDEDADGRWRGWVNAHLAADYQTFFARFDALVALLPPDFEAVLRWRAAQELNLPAERRMHSAALARFIAHYERLTRQGLATWPQQADWCVWLAPDHRIERITRRGSAGTALA